MKTVKLTEARGQLAGARVVREGYQVMLISTGGTVIKMPVDGIRRMGRATQGVIVMRLRGDEQRVEPRPGGRERGAGGRRAGPSSSRRAQSRLSPTWTSTTPMRGEDEDDEPDDEPDDADDDAVGAAPSQTRSRGDIPASSFAGNLS